MERSVEHDWAIRKVSDSERRTMARVQDMKSLKGSVEYLALSMRDATLEDYGVGEFGIVNAPWSKEQVAALKVWQEGQMPFVLSNQSSRDALLMENYGKLGDGKLVPTRAGWKSPTTGKIVQKWARRFMFKLAEDDGLGFCVTGSKRSDGAVSELGGLPNPRPKR